MTRADFTFTFPLRVRWAEVDRQDVVFNGNYFLYFDVAIAEYWRAIDFKYPEAMAEFGTDIFAVKATAEFHGSARYGDLLDIGCRVASLGRSSMRFVFGIWRADEQLTSGELVYVNADPRVQRSAPWPTSLIDRIVAFEKTAPKRR